MSEVGCLVEGGGLAKESWGRRVLGGVREYEGPGSLISLKSPGRRAFGQGREDEGSSLSSLS